MVAAVRLEYPESLAKSGMTMGIGGHASEVRGFAFAARGAARTVSLVSESPSSTVA